MHEEHLKPVRRRHQRRNEDRMVALERADELANARLDDHDKVLRDLANHLGKVSQELSSIVGWFRDIRTKLLAVAVLTALIGPDGVNTVKEIFS